MSVEAVPDWLAKRGGAIQRGVAEETRLVLVGGQPLYRLEVRPAAGRFACAIVETATGKRLDDATAIHATSDKALSAGMEQLRNWLGW
jgi:hypothetical protein